MEFVAKYIETISKYFEDNKLSGMPDSLYSPINYLMEFGGKRVRPALVLMAYDLFKNDFEASLDAAHAVELFHNFSLMHDDIMDAAPLRRKMPTVHMKYDVNSAILSGDVMLVYCYQCLGKYPDEIALPLIKVFTNMAIKLCEGQRLDMDFETRSDVEISEYLTMIEYKTAVLIACSLEMGGIIANVSLSERKALYEFGKNIGIAFQIQDDILDSFGNEEEVGKKPCGDIVQNKKTYLYLKAKELADKKQTEVLDLYYSGEVFDELEKIEKIRTIFKSTGSLEYANQLRDAYKDLAISHLKSLNLEPQKEAILSSFADYLIKRSN